MCQSMVEMNVITIEQIFEKLFMTYKGNPFTPSDIN